MFVLSEVVENAAVMEGPNLSSPQVMLMCQWDFGTEALHVGFFSVCFLPKVYCSLSSLCEGHDKSSKSNPLSCCCLRAWTGREC